MPKTCLDDTGLKIKQELYKAVPQDDVGLLAILGSWGDTMDDAEILDMLRRLSRPTGQT